MTSPTMISGSSKGAARVPNPRKTLTRKELRTAKGRFAAHLDALLKERGWNSTKLADELGFKEPTVRKWLRGESMPNSLDLETIGKALDTKEHPFSDYRMLLPPPAKS